MRLRRRFLLSAAGASLATPAAAADLDVAIIGAGVAGLAAARELAAKGRRVLLVEARDRIGGRTFTDTRLGFPFDLGPSTLVPASPLARALGARTVPTSVDAVVMNGKEISPDMYDQYDKVTAKLVKELDEVHKALPGIDPRRVIVPHEPLKQIALATLLRRTPFEGELEVPEGVGLLVARWGAHLPVKLGTRVLHVDSTERLVRLETPTGDVKARAIIVTVPASVLKGGVGFAPPLKPAKRAALAALTMALYDKVAVGFSRRVIAVPDDSHVTALTPHGEVVRMLLRPGGREAAILFVASDQVPAFEAGGPSAAGAWALSMLAQVFGDKLRSAFTGSQMSRWGKDRFAQGAWSVARPGADGARDRSALAAPHEERIFFAGEATEAGTLAGAHASGLRAAQEALAYLGRR